MRAMNDRDPEQDACGLMRSCGVDWETGKRSSLGRAGEAKKSSESLP